MNGARIKSSASRVFKTSSHESHPRRAVKTPWVQTSQPADRMGIGGYNEFNTAGSCGANPVRLEVETVRVAVYFDGAFGLGDGVQHLAHPAFERRTRPDQSPSGWPQILNNGNLSARNSRWVICSESIL